MLGEQFDSVLLAAQAGAEWALSALYREIQPGMLAYLRAHDPDAHEDIASETWMDVAAGLKRFRGDENALRRWIFTIARRRLIDFQRARSRRRTEPRENGHLVDAAKTGDVEAEALANLATRDAVSMLSLLPVEQAEVVLLRVLAGLSANDVAAVLGRPANAVRVLQHRALRRLARELGEHAVTNPAPASI